MKFGSAALAFVGTCSRSFNETTHALDTYSTFYKSHSLTHELKEPIYTQTQSVSACNR